MAKRHQRPTAVTSMGVHRMATTDRLQAAGGTTKRYLTGLSIGGWLKLGGIILLCSLGIGVGMNVIGAFSPVQSAGTVDWQQAAVPVAIVVVATGVFGYIAAVADFVFVASLRTGRLPVRSYASANLRRAGWLLMFRVALALAAISAVAAVAAATIGVTPPPTVAGLSRIDGILIGLTAVVAAVGWLVIATLTNAFVVPIMQYDHRGPLSAWRRFTRVMAGHWIAVAVFLFIAVVISVIVGTALFVVGLFVLSIGGLLLAGGATLVTENAPALEPVVLAVLIAAYLGYRYVIALIRAPVRSYLRYYALLLLGDVEPSLAMLSEELTGGGGAPETVAKSGADATTTPASQEPADVPEEEASAPTADSRERPTEKTAERPEADDGVDSYTPADETADTDADETTDTS